MLLLIDVGNTNLVFGVWQDQRVTHTFRMTTSLRRTADELGLTVWNYFQHSNLDLHQLDDVIVCSVVPDVTRLLCAAMERYLGHVPLVVGHDLPSGLRYPEHSDYGKVHGEDRQAACAAALEKYGAPLLLLDFGTATNLDVIDRNGVYRGGAIWAGVQLSLNALFQNAAKLPNVPLTMPEHVLGMDTTAQIQSGILRGYVGAAEALITQSLRELGESKDAVRVIATGGLAPLIASGTELIDTVDPDLVLEGMALLYRRRTRF